MRCNFPIFNPESDYIITKDPWRSSLALALQEALSVKSQSLKEASSTEAEEIRHLRLSRCF